MNGLLFIDDEEGVRRSVARAFRKEPFPIYTAENGDEGIAFVRENISVLSTVVSDYRMPGPDGLETLATIGAISPEITRIILTGYATMEAAIAATNEGVDGFLTKPFDNMELKAKIHEINVRKRLKQFIPARLYPEIDGSAQALAPRYHEATILFSDIRGFTRMSQKSSPQTIAAFLNDEYFSPMGEIAHRYRGMVDKHIGDSIMVVFGSPVSDPEAPFLAVSAAVEMQEKARELRAQSGKNNALRHKIGIGISTGEVFSGILGSRCKKEFTSIGMAVNIAARLQSIAVEGEILINESTYRRIVELDRLDRIETKELPPVSVKGLDSPIRVYRVVY